MVKSTPKIQFHGHISTKPQRLLTYHIKPCRNGMSVAKKVSNMKKIICGFAAVLLCFCMAGCSNEFAKNEYDSAEKISEQSDRFAKVGALYNQTDNGCIFTAEKFDGRETVWTAETEAEYCASAEILMKISRGTAKLVLIDGNGNITVLIECDSDELSGSAESVPFSEGKNRLKIVGYDCENVELNVQFLGQNEES